VAWEEADVQRQILNSHSSTRVHGRGEHTKHSTALTMPVKPVTICSLVLDELVVRNHVKRRRCKRGEFIDKFCRVAREEWRELVVQRRTGVALSKPKSLHEQQQQDR
jgi:hypothetical protein